MSSTANAKIAYGYALGRIDTKNLSVTLAYELGGKEAYEARNAWVKKYMNAHMDDIGEEGWYEQINNAEEEWIQTTEQGQAYGAIRDQVDDYMESEWSEQSYGEDRLALVMRESQDLYSARGNLTFRPPEGDYEMDASELFDRLDITPEAGPDWLVLPYWG